MKSSMQDRVYYLSESRKNKILKSDIIIFLILLVATGTIFTFIEKARNIFVFIPIFLFFLYKAYVFSRRDKALIICSGKIYSWRSGWFTDKEVHRAYLSDFGGQKCIMFDLKFGLYEPTVYSDWSLYTLPSTMVVICDKDSKQDLKDLLVEIQLALAAGQKAILK